MDTGNVVDELNWFVCDSIISVMYCKFAGQLDLGAAERI
jgi:hypothetical protein